MTYGSVVRELDGLIDSLDEHVTIEDVGLALGELRANVYERAKAEQENTPTRSEEHDHVEAVAYADDIAEGGDPVPEDYERHYCEEDGEDWPCAAIRALRIPGEPVTLEELARQHEKIGETWSLMAQTVPAFHTMTAKAIRWAAGFRRPEVPEPSVEEWAKRSHAAREKAIARGYTPDHDAEHGIRHLLNWAIDYARRGRAEDSSGLILSALALLDEEPQVEPTDAHNAWVQGWNAALAAQDTEEPESEATAEYAIEFPGGTAFVSDDRGDVEDWAQWIVDGHLVQREVRRSPWLPVEQEGDTDDQNS